MFMMAAVPLAVILFPAQGFTSASEVIKFRKDDTLYLGEQENLKQKNFVDLSGSTAINKAAVSCAVAIFFQNNWIGS